MRDLKINQIPKYYNHYKKVAQLIANANNRNYSIKQVQVPVAFSENLALKLALYNKVLQQIFKSDQTIKRGNTRTYDLVNSDSSIKIEVKATGEQGFQRFRKKSFQTDWVIWMSVSLENSIEIIFFPTSILCHENKSEIACEWSDYRVKEGVYQSTLDISQLNKDYIINLEFVKNQIVS